MGWDAEENIIVETERVSMYNRIYESVQEEQEQEQREGGG